MADFGCRLNQVKSLILLSTLFVFLNFDLTGAIGAAARQHPWVRVE